MKNWHISKSKLGQYWWSLGQWVFFCAISAFLPILAGYPWSAGTHEQQNHVFVSDMAMVQNHAALVSTSKQLTAMFIPFNVVNPRINNPQWLGIYWYIYIYIYCYWLFLGIPAFLRDDVASMTPSHGCFKLDGDYGAGTARTIQLLGRRQRLPLSGCKGNEELQESLIQLGPWNPVQLFGGSFQLWIDIKNSVNGENLP